jgi:SOS-response transcriptional repressor LexA
MGFASSESHLDGDELALADLVLPQPHRSFVYRVRDDQLGAAEGIFHGDLIIVERGHQPAPGALALLNVDGTARLARIRRQRDRVVFDGFSNTAPEVEIMGLASRVVRLLLPPLAP